VLVTVGAIDIWLLYRFFSASNATVRSYPEGAVNAAPPSP
jgi:hypothetical protein